MIRAGFILCFLTLKAATLFSQSEPLKLNYHYLSPGSPTIAVGAFKDSIDMQTLQKAKEIAHRITIIDCHSHDLFKPQAESFPKQLTFSMLKRSGVNGLVQSFPLDFSTIKTPSEDILKNIRDTKKRIKNETMKVSFALKSSDFISIQSDDSVTIMIGLEYFRGLFDGNIEILKKYYDEGVREIGLVRIGGLDTVFVNDNLTEFGIELIKEMNRLGIICDITHLPESAQIKIIETSQAPVILSHTNSYSVINSGFNATDSTLKRLTSKSGIICVTFTSEQVSEKANIEVSKMRASKSVDLKKIPKASIQELINHIDYLKRTIGIDYIGIGSDYGGSGRFAPEGLETIEGFPLIIYYMLKRGYTENEIEKVMGMNFIRFYKKVEAKAIETRSKLK